MIESFGLLAGHMAGDYLLQTDWMAANKANPHPGPMPPLRSGLRDEVDGRDYAEEVGAWGLRHAAWVRGHHACLLHCAVYTLAVWACSFWWLPWWGAALCFLLHFPLDRWRLARKLMRWTGQEGFATGPLAPWSVILVDNTLHLLTLFAIGVLA